MSSFENPLAAERSLHQPGCGWKPLINEYQGALWRRRGCICDRFERRADRAVLEWVASRSGAEPWITVGPVRDYAAQVEAKAEQRGYPLGNQAAFQALRERDGGSARGVLRPEVGSSAEDLSCGEVGE